MSLVVEARHRLGDFSLDAAFTAEGGVTALFGRSGSGKTSLVRIIAGLTRFVAAEYFEIEDPADRAAPKVSFG